MIPLKQVLTQQDMEAIFVNLEVSDNLLYTFTIFL